MTYHLEYLTDATLLMEEATGKLEEMRRKLEVMRKKTNNHLCKINVKVKIKENTPTH